MILLPHMLVGAALGAKIHNFWIIFILGIVLHLATDRLPHWEYNRHIDWEYASRRQLVILMVAIPLDLLAGAVVIGLFLIHSPERVYILAGAFFSLLPDGLVFLRHFWVVIFKKKNWLLEKWYHFHKKLHIPENKNSPFWGAIIEIAVAVLAVYLIEI